MCVPPTALIVDDDPTCCQIISHAAKERGYIPVQAQSYEHAISLLQERKFDFVTIDLGSAAHRTVELLDVATQCDAEALVFIIGSSDDESPSYAERLAGHYDLNICLALTKPLAMADILLAFMFVPLLTLIGGQAKGNVGAGHG
jgi:ActR/RegA family two-component response regulator